LPKPEFGAEHAAATPARQAVGVTPRVEAVSQPAETKLEVVLNRLFQAGDKEIL
jgi:hypothetical protein